MFEQVDYIEIKGGCFKTNSKLEILKHKINLLYGRNGSGKSTIAKSFASLSKGETILPIESVSIPNQDHLVSDSIYVFNEQFIDDNVKVANDGIGTIVMLGQQADLDEIIATKESELKEIEFAIKSFEEQQSIFADKTNSSSPLYYQETIINNLKNDWAEKDRQIKRNSVKSAVNQATIKTIGDTKNSIGKTTISDLQKEYAALFAQYQKAREGAHITLNPKSFKYSLTVSVESINELLHKVVETPDLSERDRHLLEIASTFQHSYIDDVETVFSADTECCPLCLREINAEERKSVIEKVKAFLNKDAEQYKTNLSATIRLLKEFRFPTFNDEIKQLFPNESSNCVLAIRELEHDIEVISNVISSRLSAVFADSKSFTVNDAIVGKIEKYNATLDALQSSIDSYNQIINKIGETKQKLIALNNQIAFLINKSSYNLFEEKRAASELNDKELSQKTEAKQRIITEVSELNAQKNQVSIALSFINQALSYVFFDKDYLKLAEGEGCYRLLSHGIQVKPNNVSVGERNVIALCYFFASMFKGQTEDDKYKQEKLVVIDDPISSFDVGNRVGVMSFLRWQIKSILESNTYSKVLLMSHDLMTIFDLCKIRKELTGKNPDYLELARGTIFSQSAEKNRSEYKKLLDKIYYFASENPSYRESETMPIGNVMRRVMEAYCSFNYDSSFEDAIRLPDLLTLIPENKRTYYENFMTRLLLNGESHTAEGVYALSTDEYFTEEEKKRSAKSLLLFFYYINPLHLTKFLGSNAIPIIESWSTANIDVLDT